MHNYSGNLFSKMISARFPQVQDFRIEHFSNNVEPVEYQDTQYGIRHEYPPVVCWRVGDVRYRYVLKPKFTERTWHVGLFSGKTTEISYDEADAVYQAVSMSVAGSSVREIQEMLDTLHN